VTGPPLADALGRLARGLLSDLRSAERSALSLRIRDDGRLALRLASAAWNAPARGPELDALGSWSAEQRREKTEIVLDLGPATARFQSPDVLLALRAAAAAVPEVAFRIELPAGVRDVQRARAGLDSSRPSR
jgi:hypothetical protein